MKVIFNGDDFGLTSGVNEGIIHSFQGGLLSSTSLIANGEAASEAIALARENPELDIGIHLTLTEQFPLLPEGNNFLIISHGSPFPSKEKILYGILARKINYNKVEAEWKAQIEKVIGSGVQISHMDSHQFIHLFPGLFPLSLSLAVKYNIPYIRTSILDPISFGTGLKRILQCALLKLWANKFLSQRASPQIKRVPSLGFIKTGGRMEAGTIMKYIDRIIREGSHQFVEVFLHPGIGDAYTTHKYQHWRYDWAKDMKLLLDRVLKNELSRRGVEIISYRELI